METIRDASESEKTFEPCQNLFNMKDCGLNSSQETQSTFRSDRSIAHMLPPIKPTVPEITGNKSEPKILVAAATNKFDEVLENEQSSAEWIEIEPSFSFSSELASQAQKLLNDKAIHHKVSFADNCKNSSVKLSKPPAEKQESTSEEKSCDFPNCVDINSKTTTEHTDPSIFQTKSPTNGSLIPYPKKINSLLTTYKDLDTVNLAKTVKDVLVANNIGQRVFGQSVLGLTQGSVSDLLSHPKPWNLLSLKGREPFIRMQMWLDNPDNVQLTRQLKPDSGSVTSTTLNRFGYRSPPKKKSRVILSNEDKVVLLNAYSSEAYPKQSTVFELARKLNKKPSTIVNWFHNYRSRVKRGISSNLCKKETNSIRLKDRHKCDTSKMPTTLAAKTSSSGCIANDCSAACSARELKSSNDVAVSSQSNSESSISSPMFLTATVLVGSGVQPATPIWSLQMENNGSEMTSSDSLTTLLLNVCGSASKDNTRSLTREDKQTEEPVMQKRIVI